MAEHAAPTHDREHADSHAGAAQAHGEGAHHAHNPLGPEHLFGHVKDTEYLELPDFLGGHVELPQPFKTDKPLFTVKTGIAQIDGRIEPLDLKFTKFMLTELVAALVLIVLFTRLAARLKRDGAPKGPLTNALEAMVVFVRNDIARPAIGKHDADRFLPYLLTAFFFVATCNLLGLVPWAGSATGSLSTTLVLALMTFVIVILAGMAKLGPVGFWLAQVPHLELSPAVGFFLKPMILGIEVMGLFIKHSVLAVRLFANMMAGHLVLAVILAFIGATWTSLAWWGVMPASVFGSVALSVLELVVAFIQAYVFTFLSALFIGMAVHPH